MNRDIDYRTDFYSLGILFYRAITGQLPFVTTDPFQLVYSHIAIHLEMIEGAAIRGKKEKITIYAIKGRFL